MEIENRNPFIMQQYTARRGAQAGKGRQAEEFDARLASAEEQAELAGNREAVDAADAGAVSESDYHAFLLEKMEEMRSRIRNGTIQPKIQIGAEAYTEEEWRKLLEKIDAAEDTLREQIEAEIRTAKEAAQKDEDDSDTRIITRADGAKILMITTPFGEMSIELTKPDDSLAFSEIVSECAGYEQPEAVSSDETGDEI